MNQPQIQLISLDLLDPHPNNPRGPVDPASVAELADSIRQKGILEPLIVVPARNSGQVWKIERYTVVAGYRRRAAAQVANLAEVPAIVRELGPGEQEEIMLVENLQREDLTLLQEAKAYRRLVEQHKLTYADIARRVGKNNAYIQQRMAILKLPASVQSLFDGRDMPVTVIPLLLKVENSDRQERLAQMVASRRLAVPKLKEMIEKEAEASATDKAVDKSRNGRQPAKREAPAQIYTRAAAVADLERLNGAALKYSDVLAALNGICNNCGMGNHEAICAACPLPQMIGNLVKIIATHEA